MSATLYLVDAHGERLQIYHLPLYNVGERPYFHGPVFSVRGRDDHALVPQMRSAPGAGNVDGGSSLSTVLLDGVIAELDLRRPRGDRLAVRIP